MLPHYPISSTALAACLAVLGVPLDDARPFEREIEEKSGLERMNFIFRQQSATDPTRQTEDIIGAWDQRARFEREYPAHPLVYLRAAIDAREWLVAIIFGHEKLPPVREYRGEKYQTGSLLDASILKAQGFPLLVFTGRAFAFPAVHRGVYARQVVDGAGRPEGGSPAQWMYHGLQQYNHFLDIAKNAIPRVITREDNRTLSLSVDAPTKLVDQFHTLFTEG